MSLIATTLILVSAVIHASWNYLGKSVPKQGEIFLIALCAGAIALTPIAALYRQVFADIPPRVWWMLCAAGFFQAVYFFCLSGAYRHGDLSLAYPIARSSPVFVVLVITLILGRGHEISAQAVVGVFVIVGAGFVLPMEKLGRVRLRDYLNLMSLFALGAALGTTGYSIIDDAALSILRSHGVLDASLSVFEISLIYLFLESVTSVVWLAGLVAAERALFGRRSGARSGVGPVPKTAILMGIMIYGTYLLVLVSMAYAENVSYIVAFRQVSLPIGVLLGLILLKERGGAVRFGATVVLVIGLVLVATG